MQGKKRSSTSVCEEDENLLGPIAKKRCTRNLKIQEAFVTRNWTAAPYPSEKKRQLEEKVMAYIVAEARPLCTVDSSFFCGMFTVVDPRIQIFCRKTLTVKIAKEFTTVQQVLQIISLLYTENFKPLSPFQYLKTEFSGVRWICCTGDAWSSSKRNFLGVTAHWIAKDSHCKLIRKSAAIACVRFKGEPAIFNCEIRFSKIIIMFMYRIAYLRSVSENDGYSIGKIRPRSPHQRYPFRQRQRIELRQKL